MLRNSKNIPRLPNKVLFRIVLYLIILTLFSCKKDNSDKEIDLKKDKWISYAIADSSGNTYFVAATFDRKLQIRVKSPGGTILFSGDCVAIDSSEIPLSPRMVSIALTPPNEYINKNDASLSVRLNKGEYPDYKPYVQLLANISLDTKAFYTKKYKIEQSLDWSFVMFNDGVAQWHQRSIIVREGTDEDLTNGGFMWLGRRGTQLVCYERDFSIRFIKDIDATAAYYPRAGGNYIPVSNTDDIGFRRDGLITRSAILVSVEDEWAGVKPIVWQVDLKRTHNLPANYSIRITDYNVKGDLVTATYEIFDESGKLVETKEEEWDIHTGTPKKKLNP